GFAYLIFYIPVEVKEHGEVKFDIQVKKVKVDASRAVKTFKEAKRNNPHYLKHLKNIYRVLLSRAHKGVYVYFMDKDTEEYFRSRIGNGLE
ncbi:MAG: DUF2075 domain-containing protein, partial [Candidatus Staskawiczbacteria bacterium]|nr:DUF2075 domain-containing protein [Candidatus Staskawiczbacteria bacterium]